MDDALAALALLAALRGRRAHDAARLSRPGYEPSVASLLFLTEPVELAPLLGRQLERNLIVTAPLDEPLRHLAMSDE